MEVVRVWPDDIGNIIMMAQVDGMTTIFARKSSDVWICREYYPRTSNMLTKERSQYVETVYQRHLNGK